MIRKRPPDVSEVMATAANGRRDGLTSREVEVLELLASGLTHRQIALRLGITGKTARNHMANVYEKLEIHGRAQAVLYAVREGLVELSQEPAL
jgi:DNA-binding NarL/FixJ family response regulator